MREYIADALLHASFLLRMICRRLLTCEDSGMRLYIRCVPLEESLRR